VQVALNYLINGGIEMHAIHHIQRHLWAGVLLLAVLLPALVGCDSKQPSVEMKQETSNKAVTDAKEEVTEAASAVKEASSEMVEDFNKDVDAKLTELDKQGDVLSEKAAQVKGEAKTEFQETIATLDKEKKALRQQLAEAKSTTVDSVDGLKREIEDALLKLEEKYKKAQDRFST
jgi:hypothetical protein